MVLEAPPRVREGVPEPVVTVPAGEGVLLLALVALIAGAEKVPTLLGPLVAAATVPVPLVEAANVVAVPKATLLGGATARKPLAAEDAPRLGVALRRPQVPIAPAPTIAVPQAHA